MLQEGAAPETLQPDVLLKLRNPSPGMVEWDRVKNRKGVELILEELNLDAGDDEIQPSEPSNVGQALSTSPGEGDEELDRTKQKVMNLRGISYGGGDQFCETLRSDISFLQTFQ